MNRKLPIIFAAFSLSALAVIFPLSCEYIEHPSRYLEIYDEAIYDGEWVPKIFPTDIREIHEQHNIDTNEVWLRFHKGKEEFSPTLYDFIELSKEDVQKLKVRKPFLV